jgi:hypothetical protein
MSKKLKKDKNPEVESLAKNILSSIEEPSEENENPEIPEVVEEVVEEQKPIYGEIPKDKNEPAPEEPKRAMFNAGTTKATAFIINRRIEEMHTILGRYFGYKNGDYFVLNENTSTSYANNQRKRYRCISVEDKFGFNYFLWFDLTGIGPIY